MTDVQSRLSDYFAAKHPNDAVISAYLFGSHARGDAHADHAIDAGARVFCRDEEADSSFALQTRIRHIDLMPFLRRTRRLKAEALRS